MQVELIAPAVNSDFVFGEFWFSRPTFPVDASQVLFQIYF